MSDIEFVRRENEQIPADILEWRLCDMDQKKFDFEQFIDKPILISFWATWCPPCRAELKELKKLFAELGDQMHFISVSEESEETIINSGLAEDYSFLYSTIAYPSYFQITAYPTLFLLDKDGIVIFKHSGSGGLDNEKNQSFLRALIENR
jgi:thiol-disulfide isomerase/thioredoxin